jgi:hypothetical protein
MNKQCLPWLPEQSKTVVIFKTISYCVLWGYFLNKCHLGIKGKCTGKQYSHYQKCQKQTLNLWKPH